MKEPDKRIPKLSKQEIRNIINQGWTARREKLNKKSTLNSKYSKEWQSREKLFKKYGIPQAKERREGHYITTPDILPIRPDPTFLMQLTRNGYQFIYCKICKMSSYNLNDIKNKYCPNCKTFHA